MSNCSNTYYIGAILLTNFIVIKHSMSSDSFTVVQEKICR